MTHAPAAGSPDVTRVGASHRPQEVFEQLRGHILSGAYPSGTRLPNERELAGALGVNRASLREALKRLEYLELVEVRHGQGTFVREVAGSSALQVIESLLHDPRTVTTELLRQLLEFRRHTSLAVVALAAQHRSEEHIARAHRLLDDEAEQGSDPARALAIDVEMNALLGEASGNLLYRLVTNLFTRLLARLGPIYYDGQRDHHRSHQTHRALMAAIERRDSDAARGILETMLDYSEQRILTEASRLEAAGLLGPRREIAP